MQYNNTATGQGIFQEIDFICRTNSSKFTIADKTRGLNNWQDILLAEVVDSMDEWDFQGSKAYSNLVANQQAYAWASDIFSIERLEIDYEGDGNYKRADHIDMAVISGSVENSAQINSVFRQGDPKYDAFANSALLLPVPDVSRTSGLFVIYTNLVTAFTATAAKNTAEPVFPRFSHKVLALGPSLDYARRHRLEDVIAFCEKELFGTPGVRNKRTAGGLMYQVRRYFSSRARDNMGPVMSRYHTVNYR